ncbi:hypothetical protein DH2020_027216 [Rehmannia glutinosa]|uniref:Inositol-phosphate phosphatase n=1 Tax=Rehmannia glutinosa TaxID=99300 RepID=A0ABR0VYA8_REHGL
MISRHPKPNRRGSWGEEGQIFVGSMEDFLATAVDAAKKAGEVDLVTETDKACEELIFNLLKLQFPDHKVSICMCIYRAHNWTNSTVGVVTIQLWMSFFTAVRGKGAFLNGKPIKASSQTELVKSLLATEAGTKRDKSTLDASTNRINSLLFKGNLVVLRMSGSCALNLCGIASGRLDLFYELGFGGPWDVAAGALIVTEAGGLVFDPSVMISISPLSEVAASNPFVKDAFIEALRESE